MILAPGEFGLEIDTGRLKIGDGSSTWADLRYVNSSIIVSPDPPENPMVGDQWLESDSMLLYVYYDSYWVDISSPVTSVLPAGQYDGGGPFSVYGGVTSINAGGII